MKLLVTGATGLLGSRLMRAFPPDWQVTGACHSRAVPGLVQCELTGASSAADQRDSGRPVWAGSSQANALTSAISAGGKRPRPTRPRPLV